MDLEHVRDAVLYAVPVAFNQWEGGAFEPIFRGRIASVVPVLLR